MDACHAAGLSVILDVVFNHFGPVGNYTTKFGPYLTPWGDAVNLDQEGSDEVRRFFVDNALMWLRDYHCDGLRFDAIHAFIDLSATHFIEQISVEAERLSATLGREFLLIAESDLNDPRVVRSREASGYGMDCQWNDDFHHSLFTLLDQPKDGETGYYTDFGLVGDLQKAVKHAYVYDGQYSPYGNGNMDGPRMVCLPITLFTSIRITIRSAIEPSGNVSNIWWGLRQPS